MGGVGLAFFRDLGLREGALSRTGMGMRLQEGAVRVALGISTVTGCAVSLRVTWLL